MAKIHILESSVYNQIAAGEVIESTASVVKELVENAIDAKATQVTVRIERGGKDFIQVVDNGTGIEESELSAAFLPHATSKIKVAKDLENITTLGFRGEAVASIASVSKMLIRSKFANANMAYSLSCTGGTIGKIEQAALSVGSEITVQNLFYNTPVRAKFLKSDRGEESEITACITKFMLGHPDIAFLYQIDGKTKLQSYGGGLEEVLLHIYGKNILQDCIAIDAEQNGIHIYGYIGRPNFTKANRTYQTTFINGRYVVNSTVQMAMHKAYESYIMKRQYPFYMIFIDLPFDAVDVNVHPRKTDVRFSNSNVVFHTIHKIISAILDGTADAVNFMANSLFDAVESAAKIKSTTTVEKTATAAKADVQALQDSAVVENKGTTHTFKALDRLDEKLQNMPKNLKLNAMLQKLSNHDKTSYTFRDSGATLQPAAPHIETRQVITEQTLKVQADLQREQQKFFVERAIYIGSIFQTYLLYLLENNFYIIDQHAAHERLLFDKLIANMQNRKVLSQSMLVPYIVQVNAEEGFFIEENLQCLHELGFEISKFGENNYRVESVANDLSNIDFKLFFADLFAQIGQFKGIQFVDLFKEKLAMTACKAAVKGGQQLSQTEVDALFAMLAGDIGLKCPHGRPIAIRFTKTEIEKLFKRIV